MARVKGGNVARKRRKKILKMAKGYFGSKHTLYRTAHEQVMRSLAYAYRDRKRKKRDFRKLWITRINAAARLNGLSYSKFMHGLKLAEVQVDRKILADLAVHDMDGFVALINVSKEALGNKPAPVAKEEKAPVAKEEKAPVAKEEKAPVAKKEKAPVAKKEKAPAAKKEKAPVAKKEKAPVAKKEKAPAAKKEKAPAAKKEKAPVAKKEKAPAAPLEVNVQLHSTEKTLKRLTVAELKEIIELNNIEVGEKTLKADLIDAILHFNK